MEIERTRGGFQELALGSYRYTSKRMSRLITSLVFVGVTGLLFSQLRPAPLGLFEGSGDVGTVLHPGSVKFDPASKTYTVTGSGANIWAVEDDFQFVWKKVSDEDVTLGTTIQMLGTEGDHHRKGVLMIRQSLDPDSAYADVAVHGDGLTSLQFRNKKGDATHEIESSVSGPKRMQLRKRRDHFAMWIGNDEHDLQFSGAVASVSLTAPFYVGIGVSAHDKDAVQSMQFDAVELHSGERKMNAETKAYSTLITVNAKSTDARVSYVTAEHIDAAEWSPDGQSLVYAVGGSFKTIPVSLYGAPSSPAPQGSSAPPKPFVSADGTQKVLYPSVCISTGFLRKLGDPDLSDCQMFSVVSQADNKEKPLASMQDGRVSEHPWSPDSKRVIYVAYQWLAE